MESVVLVITQVFRRNYSREVLLVCTCQVTNYWTYFNNIWYRKSTLKVFVLVRFVPVLRTWENYIRMDLREIRERAPGTHWIGGWVGHRAGLDTVTKGKIFLHYPCREMNSGRPVYSRVAVQAELWHLIKFNWDFTQSRGNNWPVLYEIKFTRQFFWTHSPPPKIPKSMEICRVIFVMKHADSTMSNNSLIFNNTWKLWLERQRSEWISWNLCWVYVFIFHRTLSIWTKYHYKDTW
jgi:hypothetical protein